MKYCFGSIMDMQIKGLKYPDILYVLKVGICKVVIICKSNYDVNSIQNFIDETLQYGIEYEIIKW